VRGILLGMNVFALPNVPRKVAEDPGVVMVAPATGSGTLPQHAAPDDATESLAVGLAPDRGAAPKRGAVIFDQTI
jgi:hypothetical protein